MNNILKELGYSQPEALSDYTTVINNLVDNKVINENKTSRGLIPLTEFFEMNECSYGYDFLSKAEALKLIKKGNLEYDKGDNTYNYSGFLERDLNFEIFNKVNSDEIYVFFMVHTGRDIRWGYSNYFVMHFDDNETLGEFLISRFNLKEIETTTVLIDIDGEACAEYNSILIRGVKDFSNLLVDEPEIYIPTPTTDSNSEILAELKEMYPDLDFGKLVEN